MIRLVGVLLAISCLGACATPTPRIAPRQDVERYGEELLGRAYRADGPGGAVLVARGDTVLYRAARGEADIGAHAPLSADSIFRIGSITKQFTAAAVLTLVQDGRVSLDDRLSRYLPDFPNADHITLAQLLNHTAGVRNFNGLPGYMEGIERDLSTEEIVSLFAAQPADFAPGANWAYSNSGYVLLGAVIEKVTGLSWHAYLAQQFFAPLGMNHTGYGHDRRFARRQVHGYRHDGVVLAPMRPMSMTQPHAAGALVSNLDDLLKWNRALHEGRLLRPDLYARMITPEGPAAADGIRYGFGLYQTSVRGQLMLQHGGHIFGFTASLNYLPGPDISVVVLENDEARDGGEPADALARRLAAAALHQPYPEPNAVPVDAATLQEDEGVYDFGESVTRTLRVIDGRLTAQRGAGPRVALTPIAADDFLYGDGFNRLRIERDGAGAIVAIRFLANGDGDGVRGARISAEVNAPPPGLQIPLGALERFAGVYANNELSVTIALEGNALSAQIAGQQAFKLRATAPWRFEVEEAGATIEFSPAAGPATELIIRQGGRNTTLSRRP